MYSQVREVLCTAAAVYIMFLLSGQARLQKEVRPSIGSRPLINIHTKAFARQSVLQWTYRITSSLIKDKVRQW